MTDKKIVDMYVADIKSVSAAVAMGDIPEERGMAYVTGMCYLVVDLLNVPLSDYEEFLNKSLQFYLVMIEQMNEENDND